MTHLHNFAGNIERFSGFADLYDRHRPKPPAIMATLLTQLAQMSHPARVVDLGSGTGLSTRYWADKAEEVIGIEPTADMRHQAEAETTAKNISYREGFSHQTGLPDQCADIVTCSQALHWMEPQATFEEAKRILRVGGVFAAYDYDWPPTTSKWEADAAYETCTAQIHVHETEFTAKQPSHERIKRWAKDKHLERMQTSGCFRYTKEVVVHHTEQGNAERLIGLLLSQGSVMTLLKNGYTDDQLGLTLFRERVQRVLGTELQIWHWSSRLRYGIT